MYKIEVPDTETAVVRLRLEKQLASLTVYANDDVHLTLHFVDRDEIKQFATDLLTEASKR